MPRLTVRDLVTIAAFGGLVLVIVALALTGNMEWALVVLAGLTALSGAVARLEFAARRQDLRSQHKDVRDTRRLVDKIAREVASDSADSLKPAVDLVALRAEIRGMRVAQQLMSQTITATKGDVRATTESIAALERRTAELDDSIRATHADLAERVVVQVSGLGLVREKAQQLQGELVDDFQGLQQLFGRFAPEAPLPSISGSSLRAAGSFFVADLIEQREVNRALHRGDRLTTLWMAYALRRRGRGGLIAFESDDENVQRTRAILTEHGLAGWVDVRVADVVSVGEFEQQNSVEDDLRQRVDLLVLDEQATDVSAVDRYPSSTELRRLLTPDALLVLADAERPDVREVIRRLVEANPEMVRLASPQRDTAVLAWSAGSPGA